MLAVEADRGLTPEEASILDTAEERLEAWQSASRKEKAAKKLLGQIGWHERKTNRQTQISQEEELSRLHGS